MAKRERDNLTKFRKFLQRKDKFGHPIGVKWLEGANSATTTMGGVVSYIIFWIQIIYMSIKIEALVNRKGARIGMDTQLVNYDEIGQVNLNDTGFIPYIQIDDGVILDEMHRYYSIEFETWTWDPDADGLDHDKITKKIHHSKPCGPEDFPGLDDTLVENILRTTRENV